MSGTKWEDFRTWSRMEKSVRLSKKTKYQTLEKNFFKKAKEAGIKIPSDDTDFIACVQAWTIYSKIENIEHMSKFMELKFKVDNEEFLAPNAALVFANLWPDVFFGFFLKSTYVPGLIPIFIENTFEDEIEEFLITTDLSKMTLRNATFKYWSEFEKSSSKQTLYKRIQKRVGDWER